MTSSTNRKSIAQRLASSSSVSASHANRPIGIFDSGVGGLTVVKEIMRQLPSEEVVYFGDTGRFPYGIRSAEVLRRFSRQNVNFLLEHDVKMIVVACNTASAQALDYIKQIYNVPMIGVIEPGARAAAQKTRTGRVGVIGTEGTIASSSYTRALLQINPKLKVFGMACPLFVALAENGYINKEATYLIAKEYLDPLRKKQIDTLVLGCTHYPPLKPVIAEIMGPEVVLVDSAGETARVVKQTLATLELEAHRNRPPKHKFFVSDTPERLVLMSKYFLDKPIRKVTKIDISIY